MSDYADLLAKAEAYRTDDTYAAFLLLRLVEAIKELLAERKTESEQ